MPRAAWTDLDAPTPPVWQSDRGAFCASNPWRTRNGSATSSTVSRSSPDGDSEGAEADRPPPKPSHQRVEHASVEPVEADGVHFVNGQRLHRGGLVDDAVATNLREVADPAEQPVGHPWRPARASGDLHGTCIFEGHVEQSRRTQSEPARARWPRRSRDVR